jgi:predicted nucleic acid-binding protein
VILYCDSSAFVKLYVAEPGSEQVAALAAASAAIAVCRITWAEAMAALARRAREQPGDSAALEEAQRQLRADWPDFLILELTQALVELAGEYADAFALRAYDSLQLAAASMLQRERPGAVTFACFDARLVKAARALGMAVPA